MSTIKKPRYLYSRPEDYSPPQSAEALLALYASGERYFEGVEIRGERLIRTALDGSNFMKGRFRGCRCALSSFIQVDMSLADLSFSHFFRSDMIRAYLSLADLTEADLTEVDLFGAVLTGANLTGARLQGARLDGASFMNANLLGANLREASAAGANLRCAFFDSESFAGLRYDDHTLFPTGVVPSEVGAIHVASPTPITPFS